MHALIVHIKNEDIIILFSFLLLNPELKNQIYNFICLCMFTGQALGNKRDSGSPQMYALKLEGLLWRNNSHRFPRTSLNTAHNQPEPQHKAATI